MKIIKIFITILILTLLNLNTTLYAETLKFKACTYEGEVKKGKAAGLGVCTFSDGSKYEGKFKKNKINGDGMFIDKDDNKFEGKFKNGKFINKIDKKTRKIIILDVNNGISTLLEVKGKDKGLNMWFEAVEISKGVYKLTAESQKELDEVNAGNC